MITCRRWKQGRCEYGEDCYYAHQGPREALADPLGLFEVVHELAQRGYTPLVAHVERYRWLRGEEGSEILEDLRAAGARFQVNRTVGKVNVPGVGSRGKFIAELRRRGWIDEVGSDLHRPTPEGRPYPIGSAH